MISAERYQRTIADLTAQVLSGQSLELAITDPRGSASNLAGECDLDVLASAVALAIEAHYLTLYLVCDLRRAN